MYQRCGAPCDLGKNDQAKRQYTVPRSKRKIWGKKYIICFTFHFEKKYFNASVLDDQTSSINKWNICL